VGGGLGFFGDLAWSSGLGAEHMPPLDLYVELERAGARTMRGSLDQALRSAHARLQTPSLQSVDRERARDAAEGRLNSAVLWRLRRAI